ncbi:hypothetical protein GCM10011609_29120 [Lentzea pudingi]|uniref:Uncharacterized protein n=1 Tax=Lentzea pudingi TaxID=1789439 RepID=A0ABQ2HSI8_9PSEU|nr:hypothetical protein GCM10011609_29120 [Lentzea pudingi]
MQIGSQRITHPNLNVNFFGAIEVDIKGGLAQLGPPGVLAWLDPSTSRRPLLARWSRAHLVCRQRSMPGWDECTQPAVT